MPYITVKVRHDAATVKAPTSSLFGCKVVSYYGVWWPVDVKMTEAQQNAIAQHILTNGMLDANWKWLDTEDGHQWLEKLARN